MPSGKTRSATPASKSTRIPQQTRSEESRQRILDAARKAFAERGFEAANIRDIAADAGVTHTLIRYHFGNKEKLWKDVVTDMFTRLEREIDVTTKGSINLSHTDGLREFLRRYVRYCARNPEHVRIMIMESVNGGERLDWMTQHILRSHKFLTPIFRQLIKQGDLPEVWLVSLFYSVSAICQMPFVLSKAVQGLYEVDMLSEAAIDAHTEAVLALFLRDKPKNRKDWPALPEWTQPRR